MTVGKENEFLSIMGLHNTSTIEIIGKVYTKELFTIYKATCALPVGLAPSNIEWYLVMKGPVPLIILIMPK